MVRPFTFAVNAPLRESVATTPWLGVIALLICSDHLLRAMACSSSCRQKCCFEQRPGSSRWVFSWRSSPLRYAAIVKFGSGVGPYGGMTVNIPRRNSCGCWSGWVKLPKAAFRRNNKSLTAGWLCQVLGQPTRREPIRRRAPIEGTARHVHAQSIGSSFRDGSGIRWAVRADSKMRAAVRRHRSGRGKRISPPAPPPPWASASR
jgi:hypothetical protein